MQRLNAGLQLLMDAVPLDLLIGAESEGGCDLVWVGTHVHHLHVHILSDGERCGGGDAECENDSFHSSVFLSSSNVRIVRRGVIKPRKVLCKKRKTRMDARFSCKCGC